LFFLSLLYLFFVSVSLPFEIRVTRSSAVINNVRQKERAAPDISDIGIASDIGAKGASGHTTTAAHG